MNIEEQKMDDFLTTGTIAEKLGVERREVQYALKKLRIQPLGRAGKSRVFAKSSIAAVSTFLESKRRRVVI